MTASPSTASVGVDGWDYEYIGVRAADIYSAQRRGLVLRRGAVSHRPVWAIVPAIKPTS